MYDIIIDADKKLRKSAAAWKERLKTSSRMPYPRLVVEAEEYVEQASGFHVGGTPLCHRLMLHGGDMGVLHGIVDSPHNIVEYFVEIRLGQDEYGNLSYSFPNEPLAKEYTISRTFNVK